MADETKKDHLVLYFVSVPQQAGSKERRMDALGYVITNFHPSNLGDLDSMRTKANAFLRAKELEAIVDIDYFPNASQEDVEAKAKEKNIPYIDFVVHLGFGKSIGAELSDGMRQLQSALQNLAPQLDDKSESYKLCSNNSEGNIFLEIPYSELKNSGRCGTERGISGFLKEKINKMLAEKYNGEKELSKVIGDDRTTPEWYKAKLMELAISYYNNKTVKEMSQSKTVFGEEKKSVLATMTEDEVVKALSKAHAAGSTRIIEKPAK